MYLSKLHGIFILEIALFLAGNTNQVSFADTVADAWPRVEIFPAPEGEERKRPCRWTAVLQSESAEKPREQCHYFMIFQLCWEAALQFQLQGMHLMEP